MKLGKLGIVFDTAHTTFLLAFACVAVAWAALIPDYVMASSSLGNMLGREINVSALLKANDITLDVS